MLSYQWPPGHCWSVFLRWTRYDLLIRYESRLRIGGPFHLSKISLDQYYSVVLCFHGSWCFGFIFDPGSSWPATSPLPTCSLDVGSPYTAVVGSRYTSTLFSFIYCMGSHQGSLGSPRLKNRSPHGSTLTPWETAKKAPRTTRSGYQIDGTCRGPPQAVDGQKRGSTGSRPRIGYHIKRVCDVCIVIHRGTGWSPGGHGHAAWDMGCWAAQPNSPSNDPPRSLDPRHSSVSRLMIRMQHLRLWDRTACATTRNASPSQSVRETVALTHAPAPQPHRPLQHERTRLERRCRKGSVTGWSVPTRPDRPAR